ncbi:MAG: hypothetical protein IKD35_00945 [Clostridia bacterium]|nr:hypothetical protein [Clostridia bacterium]
MAHNTREQEVIVVRLFKSTLTAGIIGSILFLPITFLCIYLKGAIFYFLAGLFALLTLVGVVCIIAYANYKIEFDDNQFTYRSWFGRKHTLRFDDITACSKLKKDVTFYAGKIAIKVYDHAINAKKFKKVAKKHYSLNHDGSDMPTTIKKDIFNNHVEQPEGILIVFGFILVVMIGFTIAIGIDGAPQKITAFEEKTIIAESYEVDKNHIILFDENGYEYWIADDEDLHNKKTFLRKVEEKQELKLSVALVERYGDSHYTVSNIVVDNDNYMSFETWYTSNQKSNIIFVGVFLGMDLFFLAIFCFIIYVGRNPNKFSDNTLHMFFARGTIHRD